MLGFFKSVFQFPSIFCSVLAQNVNDPIFMAYTVEEYFLLFLIFHI